MRFLIGTALVAASAVAGLLAPAATSARTYWVHHCVEGTSDAAAWTSTPWVSTPPGVPNPRTVVNGFRTCLINGNGTRLDYLMVAAYGQSVPLNLPRGTQMSWVFSAVPTTRIVAVAFDSEFENPSPTDGFTAAVWNTDTGAVAVTAPPTPVLQSVRISSSLPPARAISIGLRCDIGSCRLGTPLPMPNNWQL